MLCFTKRRKEMAQRIMQTKSYHNGPYRRAGVVFLVAGLAASGAVSAQDAGSAASQPAALPQTPAQRPSPQSAGEMISLAAFSEPVDINVLLQYVQRTLKINLNIAQGLQFNVALNAPIEFPRQSLIPVINSFLEQNGWTMTFDRLTNFYSVVPSGNIVPSVDTTIATTRVFRTPGVKPSSLLSAITTQLGSNANLRITASNDLGALIATGSPSKLELVGMLIDQIMFEHNNMRLMTFDLEHIAANTARDQVLMLTGNLSATVGTQTTPIGLPNRNDPGNAQAPAAGDLGNLSNFGSRLGVAPQGNALMLKGTEDERHQIEELLAIIDRPNTLEPRKYFTGSATRNIAQHANESGLGRVREFSSESNEQNISTNFRGNPAIPGQQTGTQTSTTGGSFMIADPTGGYIMYFGTVSQHERFAAIVDTFKTEGEVVVARVYKLSYSEAPKIAEVLQGLINAQSQQGGLLTGLGTPNTPQPVQAFTPNAEPGSQGSQGTFTGGEGVIAIADEEHNQIVVKAPLKLQPEFEALIDKLDRRRAQVYIEAQIVAVNSTDELNVAIETQLINAMGKGGAFRTNFGLSEAGDALTDIVSPLATLSGGTFALIQSKYVPIVINALQTDVDGRIISTPQLLVNDNEESTIASINTFPFQSSSQNNNSTVVSFDGSAEAGTTFTAKPQITANGSVDLTYTIELSSFTGAPQAEGAPPPTQKNNIDNGSVSVPTGMTVVVGGLKFKNSGETIIKLPLLGDIPLFGHLFRDTTMRDDVTTLYIFLTPRILDDPNFNDLMLLTRGPQAEMLLDPNMPMLTPIAIDASDSGRLRTGANTARPGLVVPPAAPTTPAGQGESTDGYE